MVDLKADLRKQRDEILSAINLWLSTRIMLEDLDGFKDFAKYINRYTASEVQFLIVKKGYHEYIQAIMDKIEEDVKNESES